MLFFILSYITVYCFLGHLPLWITLK